MRYRSLDCRQMLSPVLFSNLGGCCCKLDFTGGIALPLYDLCMIPLALTKREMRSHWLMYWALHLTLSAIRSRIWANRAPEPGDLPADRQGKMGAQDALRIPNSSCKTQRDIAKTLGISRSYVSRSEKHAINKLGKTLHWINSSLSNCIAGSFQQK